MRYLPKLVWLALAVFAVALVSDDADARCRQRRHRGCGGCEGGGCESRGGGCDSYHGTVAKDGNREGDYARQQERGESAGTGDNSREAVRENADRDPRRSAEATPPPPEPKSRDEAQKRSSGLDETQLQKAPSPQ